MEAEQRLDQQFLGPAHVVAHGAHHRVRADDEPDVAREEEVRQRRQREARLVERARDGARLLRAALDQQAHHLVRAQLLELPRQRVGRHHVERLRDQEVARLGLAEHLGEEVADLVHAREAAQHVDELPVLALGRVDADDVVVEELGPRGGRHRLELAPGRVHQHRLERPDLGGDVDGRHGGVPRRYRFVSA